MEAKDKIMRAAEMLFAEKGFKATSTRELALAAGVNIAMISYYFGSKEALFCTLMQERMQPFKHVIENLVTLPLEPWIKVERIIEGYVDRIFDNNHLHKIIYRDFAMQDSPIQSSMITYIQRNMMNVQAILKEGIALGVFRADIDSALVVPTIIGTIVQVTSSPALSMMILELDPETNTIFEEKHKIRLKTYLKTLIKAYLETK